MPPEAVDPTPPSNLEAAAMIRNVAPISPAFSRRVLKGLGVFASIIVLITTLRSTIVDWDEVPSGSMTPTILEGDRIFESKLAYDLKIPFTTSRFVTWSNPKRGDIVVFYSPRTGQRLVKRVVAVPGDLFEMGGSHAVLPADKYFVMGDNRDHSFDSRNFGLVDRGRILGKAVGVITSFDRRHHSFPRWGRFFTILH